MPDRSIESTVTFAKAFSVGATTGRQPPGTYRLTIDEEEVPGITTLVYRRVATLLHTPPVNRPGPHRVYYVDTVDLDDALRADREADATERSSL